MANYVAWNNFVMNSNPSAFDAGSMKRAAAIANLYMGLANNGGINSFLTYTHEIEASEVLRSLERVGAQIAAKQFREVLQHLGNPIPVSSSDDRWGLLERLWTTEKLDDLDVLSSEADRDLMDKLEIHVNENEDFYYSLTE